MMKLKVGILLVILLILASGCQTPNNTRLTCKYDQNSNPYIEDEWLENNVTSWDELPNKTKGNLTEAERNSTRLAFRNINSNWTNLTRYENMPKEKKDLFVRLINNETTVKGETKTYRNSIYVRDINQSTATYLAERKYFIYENDIYYCGKVTPQGA